MKEPLVPNRVWTHNCVFCGHVYDNRTTEGKAAIKDPKCCKQPDIKEIVVTPAKEEAKQTLEERVASLEFVVNRMENFLVKMTKRK